MSATDAQLGDLVSYEDMANPRKVWKVVSMGGDHNFGLEGYGFTGAHVSDLRQHGWKRVAERITDESGRQIMRYLTDDEEWGIAAGTEVAVGPAPEPFERITTVRAVDLDDALAVLADWNQGDYMLTFELPSASWEYLYVPIDDARGFVQELAEQGEIDAETEGLLLGRIGAER